MTPPDPTRGREWAKRRCRWLHSWFAIGFGTDRCTRCGLLRHRTWNGYGTGSPTKPRYSRDGR